MGVERDAKLESMKKWDRTSKRREVSCTSGYCAPSPTPSHAGMALAFLMESTPSPKRTGPKIVSDGVEDEPLDELGRAVELPDE